MPEYDFVVAGGGPAGLQFARELGERTDYAVAVLEANEALADNDKSTGGTFHQVIAGFDVPADVVMSSNPDVIFEGPDASARLAIPNYVLDFPAFLEFLGEDAADRGVDVRTGHRVTGPAVEDGQVTGPADREEAAFTLRMQDFFRLETSQTFLNVAAGERVVTLTAESDRTDYDAYVSAERSTGESASAAELRNALGDVPGFVGVETVDGEPAARIEMGERNSINASVDAFDAGMYEFQFSGVDTRDGGAVATGRVVVGKSLDRQLGVELANETLTVAVGERATTNVTLTNVTNGISAMSLSLNRTGEPSIGLRADVSINGSRAGASAGWSEHHADASAEAFDGNTGNGTVLVGNVGADANVFSVDENTTGTNTATFRIDWVVDADGTPYALPDERTITIEVVPGNATDGGTSESGRSGSGTGSGGGSSSESTSSSGGE